MAKKMLLTGRYVLPVDEKMTIIEEGGVVVEDSVIKAVGDALNLSRKHSDANIVDTGNSIIMPGLVNTHTHAAMSYFRGIADDMPLKTWLENHIWPAEKKHVVPDFVRRSSELACLEMVKSGTTCFNDMYFFEDTLAEVVESAGLRAVIGEGILDFTSPSCKTPDEAILKTFLNHAKYKDNEQIMVSFAPHSIYTVSEVVLKEAAAQSKEFELPLHIHVAETKKEMEDCLALHGKTPVQYLESLGLLSEYVVAVHAVWLEKEDIEAFKKYNVKVAHCPSSNMKLASGIAPVSSLRIWGITVGLGTDSAASNNTLDLWSDIRAAALLHKVATADSSVLPARDVIRMATIEGARTVGLDGRLGSLEAGKWADLIVVSLDAPHLAPIYDPYSHLVFATHASDVRDVMIGGQWIVKDREAKTLDEKKILREAAEFSARFKS